MSAVQLFAALVGEGATILAARDVATQLQAREARRQRWESSELGSLLTALSQWRAQEHRSQEHMAELLGVARKTYRLWESGQQKPQYAARQRIAHLIAQTPPASEKPPRTIPSRLIEVLAGCPDGEAHYRLLAERLQHSQAMIKVACHRMARDGRLRWVRAGVYALPRRSAPCP